MKIQDIKTLEECAELIENICGASELAERIRDIANNVQKIMEGIREQANASLSDEWSKEKQSKGYLLRRDFNNRIYNI